MAAVTAVTTLTNGCTGSLLEKIEVLPLMVVLYIQAILVFYLTSANGLP